MRCMSLATNIEHSITYSQDSKIKAQNWRNDDLRVGCVLSESAESGLACQSANKSATALIILRPANGSRASIILDPWSLILDSSSHLSFITNTNMFIARNPATLDFPSNIKQLVLNCKRQYTWDLRANAEAWANTCRKKTTGSIKLSDKDVYGEILFSWQFNAVGCHEGHIPVAVFLLISSHTHETETWFGTLARVKVNQNRVIF